MSSHQLRLLATTSYTHSQHPPFRIRRIAMMLSAALFLSLTSVQLAGATTWRVELSNPSTQAYTISRDGTVLLQDEVPAQSGPLSSLTIDGIDPIQFPTNVMEPLSRPAAATVFGQPSTLSFPPGRVAEIAPNFYTVTHRNDSSRQSFAAPTAGASFECDPRVLVGGRSGFRCTLEGGVNITFASLEAPEPTLEGSSSGPFAINIDVQPDSATVGAFEALTAGVYRVKRFQFAHATYEQVRDGNAERLAENRVPVGFLYLFLFVLLMLWLLMAAVWHTWYLCICPTTCAGVYKGSQERLLLVWMAVYCIVGNILVWSIGFPFWLGLSFAIGVVMLTFLITRYACCCSPRPKLVANDVGCLCVGESLFDKCMSAGGSSSGGAFRNGHSPGRSPLASDSVELGSVSESGQKSPGSSSRNNNSVKVGHHALDLDFHLPQKLLRILFALAVFVFILFVIDLAAWQSDQYFVFSRISQERRDEFQLSPVTKTVAGFYAFDGFATDMSLDDLNRAQTEWCGNIFHRTLTTDEEKRERIQVNYIDTFDIDMTQFVRQNYSDYTSVNDWFTRRIRSELRPISPDAIVDGVSATASSPADARVMAFESIPDDFRFWIKNEEFSVSKFLGNEQEAADFDGATMLIVRLAPQDYHRYHAPVSGNVTSQRQLGGTIFSVNADAITSSNLAILNQRTVTIFDSPEFGKVAFVAIGATCVGSVVMDVGVGDTAHRGDDIGFFQFGGSTIGLLFQEGRIELDDDLVYRSAMKVETLLDMGQAVGRAVPLGGS